jgi:7,8-dihydroneopterin aldolase/epimerase/oxygenase
MSEDDEPNTGDIPAGDSAGEHSGGEDPHAKGGGGGDDLHSAEDRGGGEDLHAQDPEGDELAHYEEDDEDEEEDEREQGAESVTIEITGLSLYTHHGVSDAEREVGQRLMLDLRLDVGETDATLTDRIEDTVDYGEVCQLVALIAQQRSHRTLERLCSTIADRLLADYELEGVWVKATKPEPPIPLPVAEVSVEVWREAEE